MGTQSVVLGDGSSVKVFCRSPQSTFTQLEVAYSLRCAHRLELPEVYCGINCLPPFKFKLGALFFFCLWPICFPLINMSSVSVQNIDMCCIYTYAVLCCKQADGVVPSLLPQCLYPDSREVCGARRVSVNEVAHSGNARLWSPFSTSSPDHPAWKTTLKIYICIYSFTCNVSTIVFPF